MSDDGGNSIPSIIHRSFDRVARSLALGTSPTDTFNRGDAIGDEQLRLGFLGIARRGRMYPPRHYQNFDFDSSPQHLPASSSTSCTSSTTSTCGASSNSSGGNQSHWERLPSLSQNVAPYLIAHGLSEDMARYQSRRPYVQRWRLVDVVGWRDYAESSATAVAGAVFEVNTDGGRRISTYTLDGGGWDEDCPDDAVLFGSHVDDIFAGAAAGPKPTGSLTDEVGVEDRQSSGYNSGKGNDGNNDISQRQTRKLHRHARWEDRRHVSISASSSSGVGAVPLERTERFLFRITDHHDDNNSNRNSANNNKDSALDGKDGASPSLEIASDDVALEDLDSSPASNDSLRLPPNTDGTVMVVERTYYPPGTDGVAWEGTSRGATSSGGMGARRGSTCAMTDLQTTGDNASNGNNATIVRCREVFVRCYHNGPGSSSARAGRVLSCNFEEVAPPPPFAAGPSGIGERQRDDGRRQVVRVRSVLVPLGGSDRYRVVLEGDVEDNGGAAPSSQGGCFGLDGLTVRGLLGLLSDGVGDGGGSISSSIDSSASCARKGGATVVTAEDVLSLNPDHVAGMLLGLAGGRGAGFGGAVTPPSSASALASAMVEEEERAEMKYTKFLASVTKVVQQQIEGLLARR